MLCRSCRCGRIEGFVGWFTVVFWAAIGAPGHGQAIGAAKDGQNQLHAVREIDDPACGAHWMLLRGRGRHGGPGLLVNVTDEAPVSGKRDSAKGRAKERLSIKPPQPLIIHAGDRLIVEQHTTVLTARLAAVALEPAFSGRRLQVRLEANEKTVWVVAVGKGRALLAPAGEVNR